jgi:iron complex transport system substrate-binding protein
MRICSFLPSATEIICALGLQNDLCGITFECDYPPEVRCKRVVVYTRLQHSTNPAEVDRQVNEAVQRGESLYRVDIEELRRIRPDLLITQDLCHVCAASSDDLAAALSVLPFSTRVLSLSPRRLTEIWDNVLSVGRATERLAEAEGLVERLMRSVETVRQLVVSDAQQCPRVVCLEWLEPPFVAGHWVPEMVEIAGGIDVMGRAGEPGFRTTWHEIFDAAPEIVILMPCGYDLERSTAELRSMNLPAQWNQLPAVRTGNVFAVDASSYFSRPGPRVATGLEILARALHPELMLLTPPSGAMLNLEKYAPAA